MPLYQNEKNQQEQELVPQKPNKTQQSPYTTPQSNKPPIQARQRIVKTAQSDLPPIRTQQRPYASIQSRNATDVVQRVEASQPPLSVSTTLDQISQYQKTEVVDFIKVYAQGQLGLYNDFVLGGNFANWIYNRGTGRMPQDIDLLLSRDDYCKKDGDGGKPIKSGKFLWGLELELHQEGVLVTSSEQEKAEGMIHRDKLLSKAFIKLREQNFLFREVVTAPDQVTENTTPQSIVDVMNNATDRFLTDSDVSPNSRAIWERTLQDINALISAGATLAEYRNEVENDNDNW